MNTKGNNAFTLKIIAIICMTINHIAHSFESILSLWSLVIMQIIGGFTFPIMAMLIIEGYKKTSNFKKYVGRILACAVVAYIPWQMLFHTPFGFNIMFTIALGLLMLYAHDHMKNKVLFWFIFVIVDIITMLFAFDWTIIGLPLIMGYGLGKDRNKRIIITTIVSTVVMTFLSYGMYLGTTGPGKDMVFAQIFFMGGSILCIPLLLSYNGERGPKYSWSKYLFYAYYPGHIVVLLILNQIFIK